MKFSPRNVAFEGTNLGRFSRFLSCHPFAIAARAPRRPTCRLNFTLTLWRNLRQLWHLKGLIQADYHDYYLVTLDLPRPAALATQPTDSISPWRFDEILWALFWQLFDSVLEYTPACYDWHTDLWHWQLTMTPWKLEGKRRRLYYRPLGSIFLARFLASASLSVQLVTQNFMEISNSADRTFCLSTSCVLNY